MIKRFTLLCSLLTLVTANVAVAATDVDKAELEAKKKAADIVLNDDSFYKKWSAEGAIGSVKVAEDVKDEAARLRERIEAALEDRRAWCNTRFFVNACLDESRKLSFSRDREIRQVIVTAEDVLRADRSRRISEKIAEKKNAKPDPLKVKKARVKEAVEPMEMSKIPLGGQLSGHAGEPIGHVGQTAEEVKKNFDRAEAARAQEAANIAAYEKKQREAAERMAEAESKAAERAASREEHRQRLKETMDERVSAQERYERKQQERESGLAKYF